jgi:hypothetical protein
MKMVIVRGLLIGPRWCEPGEVIEASAAQAERFTRAGAARPAMPGEEDTGGDKASHKVEREIEAAVMPHKGEQAVTRRHGGK